MNAATVQPVGIDLALVSHTNVGKTTLARTLLGQDIGVVRDAPHVTDLAELHVLLRSPKGDELRLWDTPGFGDSARLVQRLRQADNPIGWLLREVWDRHRDRPFWCSQQAVLTARATADVILYLANAAESPRDAGYSAFRSADPCLARQTGVRSAEPGRGRRAPAATKRLNASAGVHSLPRSASRARFCRSMPLPAAGCRRARSWRRSAGD